MWRSFHLVWHFAFSSAEILTQKIFFVKGLASFFSLNLLVSLVVKTQFKILFFSCYNS